MKEDTKERKDLIYAMTQVMGAPEYTENQWEYLEKKIGLFTTEELTRLFVSYRNTFKAK